MISARQSAVGSDEVPPGFAHNPTAWRRRGLLAVMALGGLSIATYLLLDQVGLLAGAWDPVFGSASSERVLDLTAPVPDAGAGVLAYATELVLLVPGGHDRWRTLPGACLALGGVLAAGAVVSLVLIAIQPAVVGHWCLLCLGSAALSLALFGLGVGEARAAGGEVRRARRRGMPVLAALRGAASRD